MDVVHEWCVCLWSRVRCAVVFSIKGDVLNVGVLRVGQDFL